MEVPSGRIFDEDDLKLVQLMAIYGFIQRKDKPLVLSSGKSSSVYVFGREDLTDHPDFEQLVGLKIARLVKMYALPGDRQPCLIGIPTAGTAMAQAAAMVAFDKGITVNGYFICHRLMREALKTTHGVHPQWVNGSPEERHSYWSIDNVMTNGRSKIVADERFKESGYPIETMPSLIFVDRQQGGLRILKEAGFTRIVIAYNLLDVTFAFGELGLWPKEKVKLVEEEIKANQF